jgi:exonuclease III
MFSKMNENNLRIMTWNCRGATHRRTSLWDYLIDLQPDVALLQDVRSFPETILSRFDCHSEYAVRKNGHLQPFKTAILVDGTIGAPIDLGTGTDWIDNEIENFRGNLFARHIYPSGFPEMLAVSVYSPAWPVDRVRLEGISLSGTKLEHSNDLWVADLLWASLKNNNRLLGSKPWIVGGDFNLSETFDSWRGGPHGNREYLDRMEALGLVECLRRHSGELTPTYRTPKGVVNAQMDHIFVTADLANQLSTCEIGLHSQIFAANLSDHLPIIADFEIQP